MDTKIHCEDNSKLDSTTQSLSQLDVKTSEDFTENKNNGSINTTKLDLINIKSLNLQGCKDTINSLSRNHNDFTCLKLEELNISSCEISDVPEDIFKLKYLTKLNLSDNSLSKVNEEISSLTNLLYLDLSSNKLTSLPSSLKHLTRLRYLNISKNSFYEIPAVLCHGLRLLRKLDMSNNLFYEFESPPLCITALLELNLKSNELVQFPSWIFSNESCLEVVNLSNNPIYESVTITLTNVCSKGSFETLKILNLQNCNLTHEKLDFISFLKNLRTLRLGNSEKEGNKNLIEDLQPKILKNTHLKDLLIPFGSLSVLPTDFGSLNSLQVLDLSNNYLSWLPDSFSELINLEVCNLSSNTISFLPRDIGNLKNLKNLFLSDNQLYNLPESFYQLKNLEVLDLYNNKIEEISCDILINKLDLKGIDLEQNLISTEDLAIDCENFKSKYESLKQNLRKIMELENRRLDVQKELTVDESTENDDADTFRSEYSEDENEELVYEDNLEVDDDWDKTNEEAEVSHVVVEDDNFDPNETKNSIGYQLAHKQQKEKELFKGNFCPADNHVPSLGSIIKENIQTFVRSGCSIVEGQFDSD